MEEELYFIVPHNEGQELNYTETFRGNFQNAVSRAEELNAKLKDALREGQITTEVWNKDAQKIKEVI